MKHARTGANYVILTKKIKLKHEMEPASNLKNLQNVGFEQKHLKKLLRFSFHRNNFLYEKSHSGNHLSGHYW